MKELAAVAERPSLLRKYIYEYALIALSACVVFLFMAMNDLNSDIRKYYQEDRAKMIQTIEANSQAIREFNAATRRQ